MQFKGGIKELKNLTGDKKERKKYRRKRKFPFKVVSAKV